MQICRPTITLRNGRVLRASDYGKEAFCWETTPEKHKEYIERKAQEKKAKKGKKSKESN